MQKKSVKGNGGKDKKKMQMEDGVLLPHKRRNEEQFTAENNQGSSFKGSMGSSNSRCRSPDLCKSPDLSCHEVLYRPRKFQVKEKSVDSEHEHEGNRVAVCRGPAFVGQPSAVLDGSKLAEGCKLNLLLAFQQVFVCGYVYICVRM